MARDPNCDFCNAVLGVCNECEGCMSEHCECDPCQHGKARSDECVFCRRGFEPLVDAGFGHGLEPLVDAMMQEAVVDQMQADIDWLMMTHSEEMP